MPSEKQVRDQFRKKLGQYTPLTPYRYAILGDGRGQSGSNLYAPGASDLLLARDNVASTRFYPVLNRSAVTPAFDLPIVIGYRFDEPRQEQIIGVHTGGLGLNGLSAIGVLGPHHHQHEFGGGDEVFSDGLLLKPGLITPTSPVSMSVQILSFVYFWDTWRQWETAVSASLTQYRPPSGFSMYLLIVLDPQTRSLVYRPGNPYSSGFSPFNTNSDFSRIPQVAGNEIPIGFVGMDSSTTYIDWTNPHSNIGDARLHVGSPMLNVLDRLRQLEGYSGNEPSIASTGAGASTVDEVNHRLGGLTDVVTAGATDGQAILFNQARNQWLPGTVSGSSGSSNSSSGEPLFQFTQFA